MESENASRSDKPSYVLELEKAFGGPSQSAFGTAVFFEPAADGNATLEQQALARYQHFCGKTWDQFGSDNWLGTWKLVHERTGGAGQIASEMENIADPDAKLSASTMLDSHQDPATARTTMAIAFDDSAVESLHVYKIGDGGAMSGILVAARRPRDGSVFLVFLLD